MTEDETQKLTDTNSFEERVLAAFAALNARMASFETELSSVKDHVASFGVRLTSSEEKVDARLRETRPVWEAVNARLTTIEDTLDNLNVSFGLFAEDMIKMRGEHERIRRRVLSLESERRAS